MVSRVVVKSATSSRDNYRLCQLIPCTYQKWPVLWYWSYIYALHSDNACKQHRADFQLYLAGKEASKRLPYHNRLYINVLARSVGNSYNLWYKHLLRHHIPADRRHNAVRSNNAILPATHAICHNVGRVCSIVCVHAKYQSKDRMRSCAWYSCRCSNARTTVVLYPLTDMGKQLQCHLWIVCRFAYVHVMGADIMADMSLRSRIVLCKSKHGRLCLQN